MEETSKSNNMTEVIDQPVSYQNPNTHHNIPNMHYFWSSLEQHYPPSFFKKVVAEMIATYLLVFVGSGSAAMSASDERKVSKLGASIAAGLIVTVMIYAVGHISGAHMNPAVTLAFAAVRHFPRKQIREVAGLAVGSAECISSILAGPISGGSMNPARTIGPAIASSNYKGIWVYVAGPITGALLAAWYYMIRLSEKHTSQGSLSLKQRRTKSTEGEHVAVPEEPPNLV